MGQDELAVLFRNNHFSTIFKKKVNSFFPQLDINFNSVWSYGK
jgi:hypothetical protein